MDLPIRIQTEPGTERVVSVDGSWGAPGLHLSHWPGNATPRELKHDLSTGIALHFARLPARDRERLARGCVALANNHYDSDGACAMFAAHRPEAALPLASELLAIAAAGDFFQVPSEQAFAACATLEALAEPGRSPIASALAGTTGRERYELATRAAVQRLPAIARGDLEEYRPLWEADLEALRADRADLARAALDDLVHLDLRIWVAAPGATSTRRGAPARFDPGRHALFADGRADRVLAVGPARAGTTYRLVLGTLSWFDLAAPRTQPRPDLAALARRLDELEGTRREDEAAWRCQSASGASPELWFGKAEMESFSEHAGEALCPSALDATRVKSALIDALRAAWAFPEDEAEELPFSLR